MIVTKGNAKCNFKTRSERNKTPNFRTKTKQTLQVFPNTSNEKEKESHNSDIALIATRKQRSSLTFCAPQYIYHSVEYTVLYGDNLLQ